MAATFASYIERAAILIESKIHNVVFVKQYCLFMQHCFYYNIVCYIVVLTTILYAILLLNLTTILYAILLFSLQYCMLYFCSYYNIVCYIV